MGAEKRDSEEAGVVTYSTYTWAGTMTNNMSYYSPLYPFYAITTKTEDELEDEKLAEWLASW